jgi:hypothetical protein
MEYKRVIRLAAPHLDSLLELRVAGEADPLRPTSHHKFFVRRVAGKRGHWVEAGQIKIGDAILTANATWAKVLSISPIDGQQTVYNFSVEGNHDYFVGVNGLLVHNVFCLAKTDALSRFPKGVRGDNYITRDLPNTLDSIKQIFIDGEKVAVQLEEAPGIIAKEVEAVQAGAEASEEVNPFQEELQWISDNPSTWDQITWYQGLEEVGNPFAE